MLYLDAFRDALECSDEAGEIAESFLRFHEQARNVEETQNQMLQEMIHVFGGDKCNDNNLL